MLVQCSRCGAKVSSLASYCPDCGERLLGTVRTVPGKPLWRVIFGPLAYILVVGGGVIVLLMALSGADREGPPDRSARREVSACRDGVAAFVYSQQGIQELLRSPTTAKFPFISQDGVTADRLPVAIPNGCAFQVAAYVDAQNGFGATVRTYYTAIMEYSGGWREWMPGQYLSESRVEVRWAAERARQSYVDRKQSSGPPNN